ncbi:MAG TPA: hypothetical protein VL048_10400 [Xanthobacteraceae bacterium]|nr:hypothetical protein [Xanthobacteraceae bacterium]
MAVLRLTILIALMAAAAPSVAYARSCSSDIDRMQARIDARVEAIAAAGPFVPAGTSAGMGVQPTPFGIATVEAKMGEVPVNKVDAVRAAMGQAREASVAGKYKACERALAQVRRLMAH